MINNIKEKLGISRDNNGDLIYPGEMEWGREAGNSSPRKCLWNWFLKDEQWSTEWMNIPSISKHMDKPWGRQDVGKFKDLKASIFSKNKAKKVGGSQTTLCHVTDYGKCSRWKVVGQGVIWEWHDGSQARQEAERLTRRPWQLSRREVTVAWNGAMAEMKNSGQIRDILEKWHDLLITKCGKKGIRRFQGHFQFPSLCKLMNNNNK